MTRREVRFAQTTRPFEYVSSFPGEDHTLLLCVVDESVTDSERSRISKDIIVTKCRYAVCWGHECSAWETAIDSAYIETDANFHPPEETFIVTTCHADEPIEETIEYWWMNTSFDGYESNNFAVLIIGEDSELMMKIREISSDCSQHWNMSLDNKKIG